MEGLGTEKDTYITLSTSLTCSNFQLVTSLLQLLDLGNQFRVHVLHQLSADRGSQRQASRASHIKHTLHTGKHIITVPTTSGPHLAQ